MSLKFQTDNILDTLFDIAIGKRDSEINKRTKGIIRHFPDLEQPGTITICFNKNTQKYARDSRGRFIPKDIN